MAAGLVDRRRWCRASVATSDRWGDHERRDREHPREQHEQLLASKSKLIEWSHLRVANLNLAQGFPAAETIAYLEAEGKESAVLSEKLGDLYLSNGKLDLAIQNYKRALSLHSSPQQENRLKSILAEKFSGASSKPEEKKPAASAK